MSSFLTSKSNNFISFLKSTETLSAGTTQPLVTHCCQGFFICATCFLKSQNKKELSNGLSYRLENWVSSPPSFVVARFKNSYWASHLYILTIFCCCDERDAEDENATSLILIKESLFPFHPPLASLSLPLRSRDRAKPHTSWRHKNNNFICSISRKEIPLGWVTSRNTSFGGEDEDVKPLKCVQWKIYVRFPVALFCHEGNFSDGRERSGKELKSIFHFPLLSEKGARGCV